MPWMETCAVRERLQFVRDSARGHYSFRDLCLRYGISCKTGYKWLRRYEAEGIRGLEDRSRAPGTCPHRIAPQVEEAILEVRKGHPSWGPRKILSYLEERTELSLPAASTAGDLLKRKGLIEKRRRRAQWKHPGTPAVTTKGPNDVWTADFKGEFRTLDGVYCYPLTIVDHHSRYLLGVQALPSTHGEGVRGVFERVFKEVGLPRAIRTDNGGPFASTGIHGLSQLNVWWLKLGIQHDRIRPGHPEQNGAHERMHRTLKAEATRPPGKNLRGQQQRFARFVREYNEERPHESLGQKPPARIWTPSEREYPRTVKDPEYPGHHLVRKVDNGGSIKFKRRGVFLSVTLRKEWIGLEEITDGVWGIYFYDVRLGTLEEREWRLYA